MRKLRTPQYHKLAKPIRMSLLLGCLSLFAAFAQAQPGTIDPSFNTFDDGRFGDASGVSWNDYVYCSVLQTDGKIIAGGDFISFNGTNGNYLVRLNTDGSRDNSFNLGVGFGSLVTGAVKALAVQSDGKIIAGGNFTSFNGQSRNYILRINSDGSLDASFNPGTGFNNQVYTISLQSDGKIIVGGNFTSYNGTPLNYLARLNSNGSLDTAFNFGSGPNGDVFSVSMQPDGKILVGGAFSNFNGRARIARLNSDGSTDVSFSCLASDDVRTISLQPDGKIIAAGEFSAFSSIIPRAKIARLNSDGSVDSTFNPLMGFNSTVYSTCIQSDGKIIAGGAFGSFNGVLRNRTARLNTDGSLDTTFVSGFFGLVFTVTLHVNGKTIVAGSFSSKGIVRLDSSGNTDRTFNPGSGFNAVAEALIVQPDGKIIVGGDFTTFNESPKDRIARLNTDGSIDNSFNPVSLFNYKVHTLALQTDGKIIVGGEFTAFGFTNNRIVRLHADGSLDSTFNYQGTGCNDHVYCLAIQANGKIIVGGKFTSYNGTSRNGIVRLNIDGSIDNTFNPGNGFQAAGYNASLLALEIQPDDKILAGGNFEGYNGTIRRNLVRLNTDGSLDVSFFTSNSFSFGVVRTIAVQNDGKIYVGGDFGSSQFNRLVRLNSNGTQDLNFVTANNFSGNVHDCILQADGKITVCGSFSTYNSFPSSGIVQLHPNGSRDISFNSGTGFNNTVTELALQNDGKIIAAGNFSSYNGIKKTRIARLNGECNCSFGSIYTDYNQNCIIDNNEVALPGRRVLINPGNIIAESDANGYWRADSLAAGIYSVTIDTTDANWISTCPTTQTFTVVHPDSMTSAPDFGLVSAYPCPTPEITIAMPQMRRGFGNQNIYVQACNLNTGTGPLDSAYAIVQLDSNIIIQSASLPYISLGNSNYRVNLGTLNPGQCVNFSFNVTIGLGAIANQTLCMSAELFPQASCVFDSIPSPFPLGISPCNTPYDNSNISIKAECRNDSIFFIVYNVGTGNMSCFSQVRLYIDGQYVWMDSIQLISGDTAMFIFPGNAQTWRLEADQHPLHPGNSQPNASIENCGTGTWTPGLMTVLPQDDADPIIDIFCGQVSAPLDPNDKTGYPLGVGAAHGIAQNQRLEYLIRFQNVGTDTAVNVVIRDTLSEDLNIFTVQSGVSSAPYSFRMYGPRILEWTFNNIMLPDSNVNESLSHGFVTFSVEQNPDLPFGTLIENTAAIYFDFEAPVITNTTEHWVSDFALAPQTIAATACDAYTLNGQTYTTSGTYLQTVLDDTLVLNLNINNSSFSTLNQVACNNYVLNGQNFVATGIYTQVLTNAIGCDSVITLNLTINRSSDSSIIDTACVSYTLNNQIYTTSGTYTQTLTNAAGCDSTININIRINQPTTRNLNINACNSYTLNGQSYTTSGTYVQNITNIAGCDSTINLNLTINQPSSAALTDTACGSYVLNNQTYTTSGTYTQTLTNAAGCDSILTLNITINNNLSATSSATNVSAHAGTDGTADITLSGGTAPFSYLWSNGATSEDLNNLAAGTYTVTITDANGCEAIENVTINQPPLSVALSAADAWTANIFPNPTDNEATLLVQLPLASDIRIRLINSLGQVVQTAEYSEVLNIQHRLQLSDLPAAIYLVEISANGFSKTQRLVILRK